MQHSRITLASAVLFALLTASLAAQQGDAQPQEPQTPTPTFRGGINFVRVDVTVTDRQSQPVTDLTLADFEVLEDGKPQAIEQFRLIRVDGNPTPGTSPPRELRTPDDEAREAARDDVRMFVLFLDDYHVRLGNSMAIREPLTRFIQTQLRPMDMVAVMYPLTSVQTLSFTRNFDGVIAAVQQFQGRKYDYRPRNAIEQNYMRLPTQQVEMIRNDVVMGALRGLSVYLGGLREARKSVIVVSEGMTVTLPAAMQSTDASLPPMPCVGPSSPVLPCNPAVNNPLLGDAIGDATTSQQWFAETDLYSRMRDVFDAANRNNTAFYTLDPRGLAASEFGIDENIGPNQDRRTLQMTQDTLRMLASETDGRAIVNRNDLAAGLAQVARDASFYYLLGYNSTGAPSDGKFHEIKVRVKRSNVDVRARKGYWAATVADVERARTPAPEVAKPIQQALASIATSVQAAKYVRTWIGSERGDNGKTRVTFLWEPLPVSPGARRETPGRVSLIAATQQGDLLFRGRTPDVAATGGASPAAGAPRPIVFEAPPGPLELRMTVEADGGGTLDQEIRTVDVPDLTTPQASISTPRLFRSRTAREFQAQAADAAASPVAAREFSRTERLLIRFDVYGAGTETPSATAVLLNRTGEKLADVPVTAAQAGGTHQISLGLNTVPPGEYLVEITATGASGEAKELIAIRVTA